MLSINHALGVQVVALEPVLPPGQLYASYPHLTNLPWTSTAAQHSCDTRRKRLGSLLWTDEVNVAIHTAISHNVFFSRNDICVGANNHVGVNTLHDIRITCFANAYNDAILDTDVCLEDTRPVDDEGVGDDQVEYFGIGPVGRLTLSVSQGFA